METRHPNYRGYRFPPEIIAYAVWLYLRFCPGFRDVEALLSERGFIMTYEAPRKWCRKFGQQYANELRRQRPRPGDIWHLDELIVSMRGQRHYLWGAVDQEGQVVDILVQNRRDQCAAKRCFRTLLKGVHSLLRLHVTDQLGSYGAARRAVLPSVAH